MRKVCTRCVFVLAVLSTIYATLTAAADQPLWKYFAGYPLVDGSDIDTRISGCFPLGSGIAAPCSFDVRTTPTATPQPWDVLFAAPTTATSGNNASTFLSAESALMPGPDQNVRPTSPSRDYVAPFTDSWRNSRCDPAVFVGGIVPATGPNSFGGTNANDVNAAIISLFANHNRLHDWSYGLGFTESNYNLQVDNFSRGGLGNDPMSGAAQGAPHILGVPTYLSDDARNTPPDGTTVVNKSYLWQPIGAVFYPQCTDGSFDMSVIAHDYGHAISNRMIGGPDEGLAGSEDGQARAMGEGWSDLIAIEYLHEHGYVPTANENSFAVGAYVTGNSATGLRNYAMNQSPLNFSNVQGYDGAGGGSASDDGEIWSAVNVDIRQALVAKYGAKPTSQSDPCLTGLPANQCGGNRRWMQLVFDAFLRLQPNATMLDARDAYLAADVARFGGANQRELWRAFAARGFGEHAVTTGTDDAQPVPSFETPLDSDEATVTFALHDEQGVPVAGRVFVGDYEANVTPIADTDPLSSGTPVARFVPGTYKFVFQAAGHGAKKLTVTLTAGEARSVIVELPTNRASVSKGATASGNGVNLGHLIDDTEATNWRAQKVGGEPTARGSMVTVDLAGGAQIVERVQVSAALRPPNPSNVADPGAQNRFTALRSFAIDSCLAGSGVSCLQDADFVRIFISSADAFPGGRPRPLAPDLTLRSFDVPDTTATHIRLVVLDNQCTGSALYADSNLENDPSSESGCAAAASTLR